MFQFGLFLKNRRWCLAVLLLATLLPMVYLAQAQTNPPMALSGRVLQPDGSPAGGIAVFLTRGNFAQPPMAGLLPKGEGILAFQTDSDGWFILPPTPPSYLICMMGPFGCTETRVSTLATNSTFQLEPWIDPKNDPQKKSLEALVKDLSVSISAVYEWLYILRNEASIPEEYRKHALPSIGIWNEPHDKARAVLIKRGTNAWPAVPMLVETLVTTNAWYPAKYDVVQVLAFIHADQSPEWVQVKGKLANRAEPVTALTRLCNGKTDMMTPVYPELKRFALKALKEIGAPAKPAVLNMLPLARDDSAETSQLAFEVLEALGPAGSEALPTLEKWLKDPSEDAQIRLAAGLAISKIQPTNSIVLEVFRQGLHDEHAVMQVRVAEGLCQLGGDPSEYFGTVTNALNHKLVTVRCIALGTLSHLGAKARPARAQVESMTVDQNEKVRLAASQALKAIDSAQ